MIRASWIVGFLASPVLAAGVTDPTPPARGGAAARCWVVGTIAVTWSAPDGAGATVTATSDGTAPREVKLPAGRRQWYDTGLPPGVTRTYAVRLDDGTKLGPVVCANRPDLLLDGGLEGHPPGPLTTTADFHRAYLPAWWEVVEGARPGGPGKRLIRIRQDRDPGQAGAAEPDPRTIQAPRRDGLHSELLMVDPRASYRIGGWGRGVLGSRVSMSYCLFTADLKPAGGRPVVYNRVPVVANEADGWTKFEVRLDSLPKDTAFVQLWALSFESRNLVWFDDLELVDTRCERLAALDAEQVLTQVAGLAAAAGSAKLAAESAKLSERIRALRQAVAAPGEAPLGEWLAKVEELDRALAGLDDLAWDLRILGLAR